MSALDTRHKRYYVNDPSVATWPNFYLLVNILTNTYTRKSVYGCIWFYFENTVYLSKHTFNKPPHWIKGIFMCFLQTRADTLDFRAKCSRTLKHCFRTSKLFGVWITLIQALPFMSKTNMGICIDTTHTLQRNSLSSFYIINSCTTLYLISN